MATRSFAKEDRTKSWLYTVSTLVLLTLMFMGTYWNLNWGLRIVCSLCTAFVFTRMFVIYHDYLHHTILRNSTLAKVIFYIFGLFTLAPNSIWKRSHDYHHNHNSKLYSASIGSFPVATKNQFLNASRREQFLYLCARHPITIIFGYCTVFLYGMCVKPLMSKPKQHIDALLALVLHVILGSCLVWHGGIASLFLSLILPCFLTFGFGAYLFYAQHNFPNVTFESKEHWAYEHAALESSSYMVMGRFMRWVTGNIGFHHIHHINSRIPFYCLPAVMAKFPEFQQAKTTSLYWKDIRACLRLKIWDTEQGKMLSLSELKQCQLHNIPKIDGNKIHEKVSVKIDVSGTTNFPITIIKN